MWGEVSTSASFRGTDRTWCLGDAHGTIQPATDFQTGLWTQCFFPNASLSINAFMTSRIDC